ncbi:MAG: hypothetical protein U0R80_06285 [Nocardioidaceae bacterium]
MRRLPHENVATVLVDPGVLVDLELDLMRSDLRLWPVSTAPICLDGPRTAFQIRRTLLDRHRGEWDLASRWTPVWIGFGPSWRHGDDPLPWAAHRALWDLLGDYAAHVRFHKRLGGVRRLPLPREPRETTP